MAAAEQVGPNHYGADRRESGEEKAKRILAEGLKQLGWDETELRARRKGDRQKIALARWLRLETTMSLKWVAQELGIGSWKYLSNMLSEQPANSRQLAFTDPIERAASTATA